MDKYAQTLADAMDQTGAKNTAVAALLGEDFPYSNVSLWRTGRRPLPAEHAPAVAVFLGVPPERISRAYEQQLRAETVRRTMSVQMSVAEALLTEHVVIERLDDFGPQEGPARIALPELVVRRELGMTPIDHIRWTVQRYRAMEQSIKRQSIVLIDISATDLGAVLDGGTYAYKLWDRPDIRQFSIHRDTWTLGGTNKEIPSTELRVADLPNLKIFGTVVGSI